MSNRLVLGNFYDEQVLRIARPGYDVLDKNLKSKFVAFDSRSSEVMNIYLNGSALPNTTVYLPDPNAAGLTFVLGIDTNGRYRSTVPGLNFFQHYGDRISFISTSGIVSYKYLVLRNKE